MNQDTIFVYASLIIHDYIRLDYLYKGLTVIIITELSIAIVWQLTRWNTKRAVCVRYTVLVNFVDRQHVLAQQTLWTRCLIHQAHHLAYVGHDDLRIIINKGNNNLSSMISVSHLETYTYEQGLTIIHSFIIHNILIRMMYLSGEGIYRELLLRYSINMQSKEILQICKLQCGTS